MWVKASLSLTSKTGYRGTGQRRLAEAVAVLGPETQASDVSRLDALA
jgi:hypothetical protein